MKAFSTPSKIFLLFTGSLFSLCFSLSEKETLLNVAGEKNVNWSENFVLDWDDFKGTPDSISPYGSVIDAGLSRQYRTNKTDKKINKNAIHFFIKAYFNQANSWVKKNAAGEKLLKHEAKHFDLAEISARQLRKKISESDFTRANYNEVFSTLWKEAITSFKQTSAKYDEETEHSLEEKKQRKWAKKIEKELKETEAFSDTLIKVVFSAH